MQKNLIAKICFFFCLSEYETFLPSCFPPFLSLVRDEPQVGIWMTQTLPSSMYVAMQKESWDRKFFFGPPSLHLPHKSPTFRPSKMERGFQRQGGGGDGRKIISDDRERTSTFTHIRASSCPLPSLTPHLTYVPDETHGHRVNPEGGRGKISKF